MTEGEGILAPAAKYSVTMVRYRARRAVLAGLFVVVTACGGADTTTAGDADAAPQATDTASTVPPAGAPPARDMPAPGSSIPASPAVTDDLSSPEHRRYQQLRVETLRLMIEAARRALPIGPFQQRIDAAARTALDVSEAADRMEEIVAELEQAIANAGR